MRLRPPKHNNFRPLKDKFKKLKKLKAKLYEEKVKYIF